MNNTVNNIVKKIMSIPGLDKVYTINYKNTEDYLYLPLIHSSKRHIYKEPIENLAILTTIIFIFLILLSFFTDVSIYIYISSFIAITYFVFIIFKVIVVLNSRTTDFIDISNKDLSLINEKDLPYYSVIIPLYKESEVVSQIKKAMTAIDYPKDKVEYIITLEEYDDETIAAIDRANFPSNFRKLILPNVKPKTKPKALNVALRELKGKFLVIYDAEIIPDKDQLKKAYLAFLKNPGIACFQTRLDHYNADQNIITGLFNSEFSFYYDLFLPGLQKFDFPIPLSGHSTHFRISAIKNIGGWDPYNVAEDCDIGIRLRRNGYRTGMLNSMSKEEATSDITSWIKQRTRWMKGFIQTSIVNLREPIKTKNELGGWKNFIGFLITVPGTVIVNAFNFIYWVLLLIWFITSSPLIKESFPEPILIISFTSFILGNLIFTYLNLIGSYSRDRFSIVKYTLLSPIYWIVLSLATIRAMYQIILNPYSWEKTTHGKHIIKESNNLIPILNLTNK
jgi:cellulose synthase/poly-beta-1,6-N-acetylglucosamine synthase-like glycosyltransferase